jgi:hypothetical protein
VRLFQACASDHCSTGGASVGARADECRSDERGTLLVSRRATNESALSARARATPHSNCAARAPGIACNISRA